MIEFLAYIITLSAWTVATMLIMDKVIPAKVPKEPKVIHLATLHWQIEESKFLISNKHFFSLCPSEKDAIELLEYIVRDYCEQLQTDK
jgi:hypothetical protein